MLTKAAIEQAVRTYDLAQMPGWTGVTELAETVEIRSVEVGPIDDTEGKFFVRGAVYVVLYNHDEDEFGNLRLYFSTSGHMEGDQEVFDSLVVAPHEY